MNSPAPHANKGQEATHHRAFESALNVELKRLGKSHPLFINGRPCRSRAKQFQRHCPSDTRLAIGRFQQARPDHIRKAIAAAKKAYPFWKELGWEQRIAFLRKVGDIMGRHKFELSALLSLEIGKNRYDAMAEVEKSIDLIYYYCQQMNSQQGYRLTFDSNGSERTYDNLEPYGVWAVVAPFDSPLSTATSMIAAATITGNTVVFKSSS
jgi:1-pyrroline-5-carboxylate dehydrogenase